MLNTVKDVKAQLGINIKGKNLREEIQDALRLVEHPFKVYMLATGVGKTRPAILEMSGKTCLIAVSQLLHIDNWKEEAKKWKADISKWEFTAYNSLFKYHTKKYDYLCLDEAQRASDLRVDWIQSLHYKKLLVLSATIPYEVMVRLRQLGKPKLFKVPLQKAIDWGILPEPSIKVISCILPNTQRDMVFVRGKDKKKKTVICGFAQYQARYKFMPSKERPNLKIKCTAHEYHTLLQEQFEMYDYVLRANNFRGVDHIFTIKRNLGARRKEFFSKCKSQVIKKLLDKHKEDRVVVFLNTIGQANEIAKYCKVKAIHSGNKDVQQTVDDFNAGKINKFICVKQADESMNLKDPDVSIIAQLSSTKANISVQNDQRFGRGIRSKEPIFYLPIFWNTQDHVYFNQFYETKDKNLFQFINENDL